jgi:hypothetical protein
MPHEFLEGSLKLESLTHVLVQFNLHHPSCLCVAVGHRNSAHRLVHRSMHRLFFTSSNVAGGLHIQPRSPLPSPHSVVNGHPTQTDLDLVQEARIPTQTRAHTKLTVAVSGRPSVLPSPHIDLAQ